MQQAGQGGQGRRLGVVLWVLAFFFMAGSAVYQRLTGPTHPLRTSYDVGSESFFTRLPRSALSDADRPVSIPAPSGPVTGTLFYKRFKTDDSLTAIPMRVEDGQLVADLPRQPAAGKLEYLVTIEGEHGRTLVPAESDFVVIRFRDPFPKAVLIPHVAFMFFAVLFGIRTGLSALFQPAAMERQAWITLGLMTVGGMILGPVVQKYAFGAFWTGFPFGYDLTDNKTLLMWLAWLVACGLLVAKNVGDGAKRTVFVAATAVMLVVYLIPHSVRGSELDYSQLDRGIPASEAIEQG